MTGIAGSNSAEGMDAGLLCSLFAVSVAASAMGLSLAQRSPRLELGCSATKNILEVSRAQSRHILVRFRFSAELLVKIEFFEYDAMLVGSL